MTPTRHSSNKGRTFPAETLTVDEVRALLARCSRRAPTGIRNAALVTVLWRAGLRCAEALALRPSDVDLSAGTLRVLHGKGDKARLCGIDAEACAVLHAWLERRATLGFDGRRPVFCTLKGAPLNPAYVRAMFPRLARRAGIEKRCHAHGLRHTLAAELRAEGRDIGAISKQLGHASIATTARYLDHVNPQAVVDMMRSRSWDQPANRSAG